VVKRCVRLYVEGGAQGKTADSDFRRGWKKFLNELHDLARQHGFHSLEIVRGKGRGNAFGRFKRHRDEFPNDLCALLVDSEGPVNPDRSVWDVVAAREGDRWQKPDWAEPWHLFLMVQMVETWLLTDQNALGRFFKEGFKGGKLPTTNLEQRSKADVEQALHVATRDSRKGPYRHGQAHEVLEYVNAESVKTLSHGRRLFETLERMIKAA
jgi:hypothetical protein